MNENDIRVGDRVEEPFKIGDRVVYVGFNRGAGEGMTGVAGTVTDVFGPAFITTSSVTVKWDNGADYKPYPSNLKRISPPRKAAEMNEFQEKVYDYLFKGGDDRRNAMKDLIGLGFFASGLGVEVGENIVEEYLKDNPRQFCGAGVQRFREAVGLKPPRRMLHLMNHGIAGDYHTLCGETHSEASEIMHRGQSEYPEKAEACPDCLTALTRVIDLG